MTKDPIFQSIMYLVIGIVGIGTPSAAALEPETAKLITEDAYTVDSGATEIELAYGYVVANRTFGNSNSRNDRGHTHEHVVNLAVTHGINDNLDGGLGFGGAHITDHEEEARDGDGFGDLGVGAKWLFYNWEESAVAASYLPGFIIPVGETSDDKKLGPGQDYWSFNQLLALTKNWGRVTSSYDLGFSLPFGDERDNERGTLVADAAVGYQVNEWFQPEFELNYQHGYIKDEGDADLFGLTIGAILNVADAWRIDTGVTSAVYGRNSDQLFVASINLSYSR